MQVRSNSFPPKMSPFLAVLLWDRYYRIQTSWYAKSEECSYVDSVALWRHCKPSKSEQVPTQVQAPPGAEDWGTVFRVLTWWGKHTTQVGMIAYVAADTRGTIERMKNEACSQRWCCSSPDPPPFVALLIRISEHRMQSLLLNMPQGRLLSTQP